MDTHLMDDGRNLFAPTVCPAAVLRVGEVRGDGMGGGMRSRYGSVTMLADEMLGSHKLGVDWEIRHAIDRHESMFSTRLTTMATCLWDVSETAQIPLREVAELMELEIVKEPRGPLAHAKMAANMLVKLLVLDVIQWTEHQVWRLCLWHDWNFTDGWHDWVVKLKLRAEKLDWPRVAIKERYLWRARPEKFQTDRLADSILAQRWYLQENGIKAQAIIVHPEIKKMLTAYPETFQYLSFPQPDWHAKEDDPVPVFDMPYEPAFCGLRVIVNPNMRRWGAYVV